MKIACIVVALAVAVFALIWGLFRRKTTTTGAINAKEKKALNRMYGLFTDNVISENGKEWTTLSPEQIFEVCETGINVICRKHGHEKDFSRPRIFLEYMGYCQNLSDAASAHAPHMASFIAKTAEVANLLREEAYGPQ